MTTQTGTRYCSAWTARSQPGFVGSVVSIKKPSLLCRVTGGPVRCRCFVSSPATYPLSTWVPNSLQIADASHGLPHGLPRSNAPVS